MSQGRPWPQEDEPAEAVTCAQVLPGLKPRPQAQVQRGSAPCAPPAQPGLFIGSLSFLGLLSAKAVGSEELIHVAGCIFALPAGLL